LVYTDDTILVGPDEGEIEKIVKTLSKNFKVEDQGDLSDYLGVNIERRKDGKIEMTQPTLTLSMERRIRQHQEQHRHTAQKYSPVIRGRKLQG
jgi:hypothetical protein